MFAVFLLLCVTSILVISPQLTASNTFKEIYIREEYLRDIRLVDKPLNPGERAEDIVDVPSANEREDDNAFDRDALIIWRLKLLDNATRHLQEKVRNIVQPPFPPEKNQSMPEVCKEYRQDWRYVRPSVASIWTPTNVIDKKEITLVTQTSPERLKVLPLIIEHWTGAISLAVYVNDEQLANLSGILTQYPSILTKQNLDIHILYKAGNYYPVNILRNLALDHTQTELVFLSDVDFVPMKGLHNRLITYISAGALEHRTVMVVPAFEYFRTIGDDFKYPENKVQLLKRWLRSTWREWLWGRSLQPFDIEFYPNGHNWTLFEKWIDAKSPYLVEYSYGYEPYVIGNKTLLPRYRSEMVGRIWDKQSHIYEISQASFIFLILPDVFTIHYPHKSTKGISYYNCAIDFFELEIRPQIEKKYGYPSFPHY